MTHAKLGLYALAGKGSPLHHWQTELSLERESAIKFVAVARKEKRRSRGRGAGAQIPKDIKKAIALLEDALKRDPHYARARANLAAAYIATGDMGKARRELDKVKKSKGPGAARLAMMRGILYAETKKYKEAIFEFRTAMQDPALRNAGTYNLARLYVLADEKAKAKKLYQRYLKTVPRGPWADAAKKAIKTL